jgi:DNA repair exonuclease SbcCD ATPase subunit
LSSQHPQLDALAKRVGELEREALVLETEHRLVTEDQAKCTAAHAEATERAVLAESSLRFVEASVSARRNSIKERVESIIGEALRMVYGNNYALQVDYAVKNNRSTVDFRVVKKTKDGDVVRGIEGVGGGVADTISLPLKLVVLRSTPNADKVLLTDEAGKHIDLERVERFADFIRLVSKKLGVQVIMCTHHEALVNHADVVYRVINHDGHSQVERLK